ncbi:MAG: DMT family transporter [Deltaproteobacteria bacterium]|nr:DMT family transporter [Deltaproteobacteria bacterium]
MGNDKKIGYAAAIMSVLLTGAIGIFVRNISANGSIITFARLGIGLVFLSCFLVLKKEIRQIRIIKFSHSLLLTGIWMAMVSLCYINAINSTSLANAAFLLYLAPIIAVGIAAVLLKEKFTLLNGGLLCLAFLGFLFFLEFEFFPDFDESRGFLWGIGSAICYALYIVFNRKIPDEIPALTRSFYQLLVGAITMVPFLDASILSVTLKDINWLVAIGFFQGFLAISLFVLAVKYLKTVEYSTVSYVEPLAASLIGVMIYSESMTMLQFVGCAIVFSGGMLQIVATKTNPGEIKGGAVD